MRRWKSRATAFVLCFVTGLLMAFMYTLLAGLLAHAFLDHKSGVPAAAQGCAGLDYFARPEEVLDALKSEEVTVRREMFRRIFTRPGIRTTYYDYERDLEYPERADRAELQYVNLDESAEREALVTFVRLEHPVALILKKEGCGWRLVAALNSWLCFEQYPYKYWLTLPEAIEPGRHEILVHESTGDAASYVRQARLLRLMDGSLAEVASYEEESVSPLEGYKAADWSNVRARRITACAFEQKTDARPARITLEITEQVVKYGDVAEVSPYWRDADGNWHAGHKHWSLRPIVDVKVQGSRTLQLSWNEQQKRFMDQ